MTAPPPDTGPFAGWTLTQTGRTPTARAWTLTEEGSPGKALYLTQTWEAYRGRWRRRAGAAGVDTRALIGQEARGEDEYGRPRYAPDTDESRTAEVRLIEAAFERAFGAGRH